MNTRALLWSGGVLGFGLGGFFDGIVLHQVLQWHHLASNRVPMDTVAGLELNTFFDGLFHLAAYAITIVGLILLWRAIHQPQAIHSPRAVISGILLGFGIFHVVDSILNHWILNLHQICGAPNTAVCNGGYFAIGIVLIAAGLVLLRTLPSLRGERAR